MPLGKAMHQMPAAPQGNAGRTACGRGEAALQTGGDEAEPARHAQTSRGAGDLLCQALARENLAAAWKRVKANKGSAGVDGRTVQDTAVYLKTAWPEIRARLLDGSYRPEPVRRVAIPKPGGGQRELGIPTVVDRLIQQALLQVLQPLIDPSFSEHSHGFRPGRSAHGAVLKAQQYVQAGLRVVVDVDLEKFLDRTSYCPLVHEASSNKPGCSSKTLILKPFLRPWQTRTASRSPRFTRCNTVWRVTPRRLVASIMAT
jgi:RNA-directed DNA polymerase